MEKLTAKVIKEYIVDKNQPVIASEFKAKGRELVERFGVTVPEAIDILNNRNILEILCKYEHSVEERQHGYWKNGCCTVCGESAATDGHFDFIPEEEQKYCWNCGAIMDGEEK